MNWDSIIGGAIAAALAAMLAWYTRGTRASQERADIAATDASTNVIEVMRGEFNRLAERVHNLETRELRLLRHVYKLESMLRELGKDPPAFDMEATDSAGT